MPSKPPADTPENKALLDADDYLLDLEGKPLTDKNGNMFRASAYEDFGGAEGVKQLRKLFAESDQKARPTKVFMNKLKPTN